MPTVNEIKLLQIEKELEQSLLSLKPVHSFAAKSLIKDRVIQVYSEGIKYVSSYFKIPLNLNRDDFRIIDKITNDVFRNWRYGGRLDAALVRVTSVTLAEAIKAKARQIKTGVRILTASTFDPD